MMGGSKKWIVEVQQPKYFSKEKQWKYSVLVEIDEYGASIDASSSPLSSQDNMPSLNSSFTAANNTRSLEDFIWLEQALLAEYHGVYNLQKGIPSIPIFKYLYIINVTKYNKTKTAFHSVLKYIRCITFAHSLLGIVRWQ